MCVWSKGSARQGSGGVCDGKIFANGELGIIDCACCFVFIFSLCKCLLVCPRKSFMLLVKCANLKYGIGKWRSEQPKLTQLRVQKSRASSIAYFQARGMICDVDKVVVHHQNQKISRVKLTIGTSSLAIITVPACCDFFGQRYYFFKLVYRDGQRLPRPVGSVAATCVFWN